MFKVDLIVRATGGVLLSGSRKDNLIGLSTDSRKIKPQEAFLALRGQNFDGHDFIPQAIRAQAGCLIIEKKPKVRLAKNLAVVKVKDTLLALGDIARCHRQYFNLPLIAVTGSNGKTTTKEMAAWVLGANAEVLKNEGTKNNQIGLPQTLLELSGRHKFAVVEIGTNHFGEVGYLAKIARPNIGIITNIGPSHLEFLKDLKGVYREKVSLLNFLTAPKLALLNADDPAFNGLVKRRHKQRIFTFGMRNPSDFFASAVRRQAGKIAFKVNAKYNFELSSLGVYNIYNALAAIAIGRIFGLSYAKIQKRLAVFQFPKSRLNFLQINGLQFIDDTYNSNPLSLKAALDTLGALPCAGRKILVMGDMRELGKQKELLHRQIAWSITSNCDYLIAVGNLARLTAQEAVRLGLERLKVYCCNDAQTARNLLFKKIHARPQDLILVKGSRSMKMEEVLEI